MQIEYTQQKLDTMIQLAYESLPEGLKWLKPTEDLFSPETVRHVLFSKQGFNYTPTSFQPVPNMNGDPIPHADNAAISKCIGLNARSDSYIGSVVVGRRLQHIKVLSA